MVLPLIFNLLIMLALGGGVFKVARVLRFGVHGSFGTGYPTRRVGWGGSAKERARERRWMGKRGDGERAGTEARSDPEGYL